MISALRSLKNEIGENNLLNPLQAMAMELRVDLGRTKASKKENTNIHMRSALKTERNISREPR